MQTVPASHYQTTCIDAGVDWLTATARGRRERRRFDTVGKELLEQQTAAGVEIQPAAVRDYVGWSVPGIFVGTRRDDSIIRLSSTNAAHHWKSVADAATNVSRLDLQVTVWTHGEQPALSRYYYQRVRRQKANRGRPRSYSLIQTHPHGDTLYVCKRQSDGFGRVYDYASAHASAPPRTVWRYEVEFKRNLALHHSNALSVADAPRSYAESVVADWYDARGIGRSWTSVESPGHQDVYPGKIERDVLLWFETSLSKTVSKAIRRHGVAAVIQALNLSQYVIERPRKEQNAYANLAAQALHGDYRGRAGESAHGQPVLDKGR